jgi:CheR methyltransferase, all-alpha domain.
MEYSNLNLSDDVFKKLKDMIYEISGIFFSDQKKYLLETDCLKGFRF